MICFLKMFSLLIRIAEEEENIGGPVLRCRDRASVLLSPFPFLLPEEAFENKYNLKTEDYVKDEDSSLSKTL